MRLNEQVKAYWEAEPCGTGSVIVGHIEALSRAWFERIEQHRYEVEPFIHSIAQFTRHRGKRLLEVGIGAGTDHLQWARAGVECHGVDLTQAAVDTTRKRLELYGLTSQLLRLEAESLPFPDAYFDIVYSWGVIHHAERPVDVVREIHRVLKPGGEFIGMLYSRRSLVSLRLWVRYALGRGRPWRSFADVIWHHMESVGTKAYTRAETRALFGEFTAVRVTPVLTTYDLVYWPRWLARFFPDEWGWFNAVRAMR